MTRGWWLNNDGLYCPSCSLLLRYKNGRTTLLCRPCNRYVKIEEALIKE